MPLKKFVTDCMRIPVLHRPLSYVISVVKLMGMSDRTTACAQSCLPARRFNYCTVSTPVECPSHTNHMIPRDLHAKTDAIVSFFFPLLIPGLEMRCCVPCIPWVITKCNGSVE